MIIECPADLGEKVYHLSKITFKKSVNKDPEYVIIPCTVDSIHIGRKLKNIGDTYIRLRSINTGYISTAISFEDFEKDCFHNYQDAVKAKKEREYRQWKDSQIRK